MTVYAIIILGTLSQISWQGSRIAVSLHALELGASQFAIGVLVAFYAVFPMLLAIPVGKLVDRIGLWPPLILGVTGMAVALVLPPLFPGITVLYVSCITLGLSHLLFAIPIDASIGGIGGPEKRAANYTLLSMGWAVSSFAGPVVAGLSIDYIGHVQVFWVLAGFSVLPMLILLFKPGLLPSMTTHAGKEKHGGVLELWRMPSLRTILISAGIINSANNLFQFYFPIYGHTLGFSASTIGFIVGVVAAAAFVIRCIFPILLKKWTEAEILTYAIFVSAFAFVLFPFVANPYALAAIAFILGLGTGCSHPLSMSLIYVLTPPGRAAEAMGLLRTMYNITQLGVPLIFGSVGTAFGLFAVFLSNSTILFGGGLLIRKNQSHLTDPSPKIGNTGPIVIESCPRRRI